MSLHGIDVSHWQGKIDYDKFCSTNYYNDFVIAKATESLTFNDDMFERNMRECIERSILHGAYHYLTSACDGSLQAEHFLDIVDRCCDNNTVFAVDVEDKTLANLRYDVVVDIVQRFCNVVHEATNVYPLVYVSRSFMRNYMFEDIGKLCAGWIASWGTSIKPRRNDLNTTIWQWTSKGNIYGIQGSVDLNIAYLTRSAWLRLAVSENRK